MPDFVFKVGSLDLSPYVRVTPGEGWDPFADPFTPQFGDNPLGDGQPLLGVTANNRDGIWPVHLTAATKDGLHDLIASIRIELDKDGPMLVEWRDDSATASTFFTVVYGKFVPDEWNYRRSQHNWASGKLKLTVKPYGHTGTYRYYNGVSGTAAALAFPLAGAMEGDGEPDSIILVDTNDGGVPTAPGGTLDSSYPLIPFAAMVPSGYQWFLGASRISGGSIVGASGAIASMVRSADFNSSGEGHTFSFGATIGQPPNAQAIWKGRNRVLLVARTGSSQGVYVSAEDQRGRAIGPTAMIAGANAAGRPWSVVDLGAFTVDASAAQPPIFVNARTAVGGAPTGAAGGPLEITGVFVLPEDRTTLVTDTDLPSSWGGFHLFAVDYFFNSEEQSTLQNPYVQVGASVFGWPTYLDGQRRGAIPRPKPGSTDWMVGGVLRPGPFSLERALSAQIYVREKFTFAR